MSDTTPSPSASERAERAMSRVAGFLLPTVRKNLHDYITTEITAAEQAARREALEEAANIAEKRFSHYWSADIVAAIRSLAESEPPSKETV